LTLDILTITSFQESNSI